MDRQQGSGEVYTKDRGNYIHCLLLIARTVPENTSLRFFIQPELARAV